MSCDVGEVIESLENEQSSFSNLCHFTYVTAHSPNPSVALPTSQLILQPFFRFSYVTGSSLTSPGELPMTNDMMGFKYLILKTYVNTGNVILYLLRKIMSTIDM